MAGMRERLPGVHELIQLRDQGKTYKEIAAWVSETTGEHVSPTSIGSALSRAGATKARPRYKDHLPWVVHQEHISHYAARMLRALGRRDAGLPLSEMDNQRLDAWLEKLKQEHAVVAYVPDSEDGFYYVDGDWPANGIPIKRPGKGAAAKRAS